MTKVMFDTNFLIDLVRFRIDIQDVKTMIGRSEFYTVDTVIRELEGISTKKSKSGRNARIALKIIELNNIKVIKSREKSADEAILKLAKRGMAVATNDIELKKSLIKQNTKVIYLRSKKHLELR
ncbi:MAG TPA: PIN domain-containing protein [archaeon]|nr:PIN domain-containing protein [archaeon]